MGSASRSIAAKGAFLLIAYRAHGLPFAGATDYLYALLTAYFLAFGLKRERVKPLLLILGLGFLALGRCIPQLAVPEQQRLLIDDKGQLIPPAQFLKNISHYPYSLTADGYIQGYKDKRLVRSIDIQGDVRSLRSGWVNRPDYNFIAGLNSYKRWDLPFVVRYDITPQMAGMILSAEGAFVLDRGGGQEGTLQIPAGGRKMILPIRDLPSGTVLYGFGGKWDEKGGVNRLVLKLEKTTAYRLYDFFQFLSSFVGLGLLFFGAFTIRPTLDFCIQSFILGISGISFWLNYASAFFWGILAERGGDGIVHGGYAYGMLEKWAEGDGKSALMACEPVFYFMPGMRYVRFVEMLLFGDAYIFQICLLIFTPVLFYRFFSVFLCRRAAVFLTLVMFAHLLNGIGLSFKLYVKSLLTLYGEGTAYALLFMALTLLAKSIQKTGVGILVFFLFAVSISIRLNLLVFVGVIAVIHLFTTTFSSLPWGARFAMLFGLAPTLLMPLHNVLGGEFVLLTKASQIPENLPLSPFLYFEALRSFWGGKETFLQADRFAAHFQGAYLQGAAAWLGCLWLSLKGQTAVLRALALATFAGLSVHFFYLPALRYLHPYLTTAIVLGLSQIPRFRVKEPGAEGARTL